MRRLVWVGCLFTIYLAVGCNDELDDLKPDLIVTRIDAPDEMVAGDSAPVSVTIWNRGVVPANAPFVVMIEFSTDPGFSSSYTYWTWDEMSVLPARAYRAYRTYSETFGPEVLPGQLYMRATADRWEQVIESVEDNNSLTTTMQIVERSQWPDLTVAIIWLPTNIEVGTYFWLDYTVTNLGDATSPVTFVEIATEQPFGVTTGWWADTEIPSLAPEQSYSDSVFLTLSALKVPVYPELMWIAVDVDYLKLIQESDETNNLDDAAFWAW